MRGRRPLMLRAPLSEDLLSFQPESSLHLSQALLLKNLKCAKRGAAGGPSGMTAEHLRPVLEFSRDAERFWSMCQSFARGDVPEEILQAVRMGRITALQKPTGGVRGIVAGDIIRRLVARTIAQQLGPAIERATAPFQYALTTRAGCECIGHILQSETDASPNRTVLSIDGIGAFDLVSRESMMRGLLSVEGGQEALPFVRQFYGAPSTYLWQDDMGVVHEVHQGEGDEQGDALMPALFSLGQHSAFVAVQEQLGPDERLFAFLDDIYVTSSPNRVVPIFNILRIGNCGRHARIQVHLGKTQIWNQGGEKPPGCDALTTDARRHDPNAVVWKGDRALPLDQLGLIVLGTPLGSVEFVQRELAEISVKHQSLLDRIPQVQDLQSAWLLLLFCAVPRPNYFLRMLHPEATRVFAAQHDSSVKRCLEQLIHATIPDTTWPVATLPLALGGLGLRSASRGRQVSFWSSWADVLHMVRLRHPAVAETMLEGLNSDDPRHSHIQEAVVARSRLQDMGFRPPEWHALTNGERPHGFPDPDDVGPRHCGWQRAATQDANGFFLTTAAWPRLSDKSRALLRSQGGPLAGLPFSCCPSSFHTRFAPQVFRVLLLRRLWLLLPLTKRTCGCGRLLDSFGHHRAPCANVGVLGRRGFALESAAARVCREAGGRVSVNQYVRDLDIAAPNAADNRRLEVVADGLPLFHGAQLAIDTTMVSPLSCSGVSHARCADVDGAATMAARRRKQRRYPELAGEDGRVRLVVLACEVGGRFSEECRHFLRQLSKFKARDEPPLLRGSMLACSGARALALSLLEQRGGHGVDGPPPLSHDVLWEARYVT